MTRLYGRHSLVTTRPTVITEVAMTRLALASVLLVLFGLASLETSYAGCTATQLGDQASSQCDNFSGTQQWIGHFDFYHFSDGTSVTQQRFGQSDFFNSQPNGISDTHQQRARPDTSPQDEIPMGTHQEVGPFGFDSFSDGTTCSSRNLGPFTFTECQ
ncbi:MAG: hypothetical protein ACE5NA_08615 [Nitrospiraceae bacterium]